MRSFFSFFSCALFVAVVGCGASADTTDLHAAARKAAADGGAEGDPQAADQVEIVKGVPDRNRDPAVVAVGIGESALCTGTLISSRLVLTARHCTSRTVESVTCPAKGVQILGDRDPKTLGIYLGDDYASASLVAHGTAIVAPSGVTLCDADIAIIVLDTDVKLAKPLPVSTKGATVGARLRAVGYGRAGDGESAGTKLVREHVKVLSATSAELLVGEATCQGDSGGPAIDESTGAVVGVVSRGGPQCDGTDVHNIYTRVDAFSWVFEKAFAEVAGLDHDGTDGGVSTNPSKGSDQKPPSDTGSACDSANDCAAGICITAGDKKYCSRSCGTGDRCPNGYHCQPIDSGGEACVDIR